MLKIRSLLFLLSGLLVSCHDDPQPDSPASTEKVYLISATLVQDIPLVAVQLAATGLGDDQWKSLIQYGVKSYRVVYQTTFRDKPIQASGMMYIPDGLNEEAPIISLQHGTTFLKSEAPSEQDRFTGMELFASAGYVAVMPDFIGYGESSSIFHPYYDKSASANAVIDMIKSARNFLTDEDIPFSNKLFLAGYSEGGYVTLAAANEIESNPEHGLSLTAVAAGAGGYDLNGMLEGITTQSTYSYPAYLAFVLIAYNNTYNWNKPLNYFFAPAYADSLNKYMDGEHSGSFINSRLTTNVTRLFDPVFYANLKSAGGERNLKQALENNSVDGWKTNVPVRLYHGTRDEIIPYQNSETTFQNFKNAGSQSVTLTLIPEGTHGSSFAPMLRDFVPWFESFR